MLMRIGNTVPDLRFRGLRGSAMAGNPRRVVESRMRETGVGGTRLSIQRFLLAGGGMRVTLMLPWRW